jgi:uncharacterized protein YbbC (DUF1343 family)
MSRYLSIASMIAVVMLCNAAPVIGQPHVFLEARMSHAEKLIQHAIEEGEIPGAVLLVGVGDRVVYRKAFGQQVVEPEPQPMAVDAIFDLASLTKPVATASSVMLLVQRGQLSLSDRVAAYLPDFAVNGKGDITIEQLLLHTSGLIADNPMSDYEEGKQQALQRICELRPVRRPGSAFVYSDVGYIVLGKLVEIIDGRTLDVFTDEEIFEPLGMKNTMFTPPDSITNKCVPTEQRDGRWLRGRVHDPRAAALEGVAGHAGLFSTADDLARWCQMMIQQPGSTVLAPATINRMTWPQCVEPQLDCRGLGLDIDTALSSARGDLFPPMQSFGHTGFTGTSFWIDPTRDCYVILLTSRLHPDGRGSVVDLRRNVASVVAGAVIGESVDSAAEVYCGIDVLAGDNFNLLSGSKVGLITNQTGLSRTGRRTIDLLQEADDVQLVALFSPEHGLKGILDEQVKDSVDKATRLRVHSLYGQTRRPSAEMLEDIDTLVFDIQDIGTRFYTYISTMGYAMEEAARHGIRFVVLDRPNPITGIRVDGPLADPDLTSFTAYKPIPVVHGMTIGELAMLLNAEFEINCELEVVALVGWHRSMWWDETGLMWVNPSPNMRNLTQATLYPAIGLLEMTNISVGRGTDQPFEQLGAPWIDGRRLADALNTANLPGIRFVPISFTPDASKFKGEHCQGVYMVVTARNAFQPVRTGLMIAWQLKSLFDQDFETAQLNKLLANEQVAEVVLNTATPENLPAIWQASLERFKRIRGDYLLYP